MQRTLHKLASLHVENMINFNFNFISYSEKNMNIYKTVFVILWLCFGIIVAFS